MPFTMDNLDVPISELVDGSTNNETPREFIRNSEIYFNDR